MSRAMIELRMGYKCPKCGYERQPKDLAPENECPKCGVVYEKYNQRKDENYKEAEALYVNYELSKAKDLFKKIENKHPELNDKCQNYLKKIEKEEINKNYIKEAEQAIKERELSRASVRLKNVDSEFKKIQLKVANLLEKINDVKNQYDEVLLLIEKAMAEERFDDAEDLCKKIKSLLPFEDEKINNYLEKLDKEKILSSKEEALYEQQHVEKLIKCPDCDKKVSRRAIACPNCGSAIQELQKSKEYANCKNITPGSKKINPGSYWEDKTIKKSQSKNNEPLDSMALFFKQVWILIQIIIFFWILYLGYKIFHFFSG